MKGVIMYKGYILRVGEAPRPRNDHGFTSGRLPSRNISFPTTRNRNITNNAIIIPITYIISKPMLFYNLRNGRKPRLFFNHGFISGILPSLQNSLPTTRIRNITNNAIIIPITYIISKPIKHLHTTVYKYNRQYSEKLQRKER